MRYPAIFTCAFVLASSGHLAAQYFPTPQECQPRGYEVVTDDFYFTASSEVGAVGDVVGVDVSVTALNPRKDMSGMAMVVCYDPAAADLLQEVQYSEPFDRLFAISTSDQQPAENGKAAFLCSGGLVRREVAASYFPSRDPVHLATIFFRLKGNAGTSFQVQFCDRTFFYRSLACRWNSVRYRTTNEDTQDTLSTRHLSGTVRILDGPATHPDPPPLPPNAKVYPEAPAADTAAITFELSGGVAAPDARDVPLDLHITSNYEWSGHVVSLKFPASYLELERVEEHTRPGAVRIDNQAGLLTMAMLNSSRRVGAEGERARVATLYFHVKPEAAAVPELEARFERTEHVFNWIQIHHLGGVDGNELPVTAQVEPLQVANALLRIQKQPTLLGDVNLDYDLNVSDPVALLGYLFLGKEVICPAAADFNEDRRTDISDAVAILNHLFLGGPAPAPRSILCGGS